MTVELQKAQEGGIELAQAFKAIESLPPQHQQEIIAQKLKESGVEKWSGVCKFDGLGKSTEVRFHLPGAVVGKGRARIGKVGNHARMFTPEKTVLYESLVAWMAHEAMVERASMQMTDKAPLMLGPLQANLLIGVQIPASFSKKKRAQALAGEIYPTTKPDLDNCIKSVFDAMNGVVYADDKQIVTTVTKKRYREAPGLWVTVFALGETT